MTLKLLIELLQSCDPNLRVSSGFGKAISWRGVYAELAFEPAANVTVGAMLKEATRANGQTFTAYKGGEYTMDLDTHVHLEEYGTYHEGASDDMVRLIVNVVRHDLVTKLAVHRS